MEWTVPLIYIAQGILLGLQAGFSPGPFTAVVISESLAHGRSAGVKCSLTPLCSDPPVILLSLLVLDKISGTGQILGCVSLLGAILLAWIAYNCFQVRPEQFESSSSPAIVFPKVVAVNFLNPNLYIYWMTIIGPLCLAATRKDGAGYAVLFVISFYITMISVKMILAIIAGSARHRLNGKWLAAANRLLGIVMLGFVARFGWNGLKMLFGG
jgi:threonine/homoserine/homoserine lactone efflux protein